MNIIQKQSPNYTKGRGGFKPEKIIIHVMAGSFAGTDDWFLHSSGEQAVSANYGLGHVNGKIEIHQYVQDGDTAYAQGKVDNPNWKYRPGVNPNKYCISIEHEGFDLSKSPEDIIAASAELVRTLATEWNIPISREDIHGHYEIRASKPNCPATDKSVIDKIITLAKGTEETVNIQVPKSKLAKVQAYILTI